MKTLLRRLLLVVALLYGVLGSGMGAKTQGVAPQKGQKGEEQVRRNDKRLKPVAEEPQSLVEFVFRSAPSSHRVASSRPTRLLPTHGGKPGKHLGRWAASNIHKPLSFSIQQACRAMGRGYDVAAPSRLYYVIALRRLLC